jgi:hypothetical protein
LRATALALFSTAGLLLDDAASASHLRPRLRLANPPLILPLHPLLPLFRRSANLNSFGDRKTLLVNSLAGNRTNQGPAATSKLAQCHQIGKRRDSTRGDNPDVGPLKNTRQTNGIGTGQHSVTPDFCDDKGRRTGFVKLIDEFEQIVSTPRYPPSDGYFISAIVKQTSIQTNGNTVWKRSGGFGDEGWGFDCSSANDRSSNAGFRKFAHVLKRTHPTTCFHRNTKCTYGFSKCADHQSIDRVSSARCVKVDDVNPPGSRFGERNGDSYRIIVINSFSRVVALSESNALSAPDVDCGIQLH